MKQLNTGVAWCTLSVSERLCSLVSEIRDNEEKLAATADATAGELAIREIVTHDVDRASELAKNTEISNADLFTWCADLKGQPWGHAPARRDMRELIRIYRALESKRDVLPSSPDDFLRLWSAATQGEVPVYKESATAQFRKHGIPFAHGLRFFDYEAPPAGYETVEAARIPHELDALARYIHQPSIPVEILVGSAHFLFAHIHPFRDGNGRTVRLLSCLMLAERYSTTTLLAFVRRMQANRATMSRSIATVVQSHGDLEAPTYLFMNLLKEAQLDLLQRGDGRVGLPLRAVDTDSLDLVRDSRPEKPVFRMGDGHVLELITDPGDFDAACVMFAHMQAAWESGTTRTKPLELVREREHDTTWGYAVILKEQSEKPVVQTSTTIVP